MDCFYILHRLCNAFGPSTLEDEVLQLISQLLGENFHYHHTPHKNLLVVPKRDDRPRHIIFFQAHTDEVAVRPFRYLDNGFVELTALSPLPAMAANHRLRFSPTGIHAILVMTEDGQKRKYYADVGARTRVEAQALIPLLSNGAYVGTMQSSSGLCAGKSFDDRAGCSVIVNLLQEMAAERDVLVVGAFTAREETGNWPIPELVKCCEKLALAPNLIINIEGCPGGPTPIDPNPEAYVGHGVVLAHTDKFYACDASLSSFMTHVAQKYAIHHQHMSIRSGGGEIGRLALSFGVPGYSLTIPIRYMHAPNSVMAKVDYQATIAMAKAIVREWQGNPLIR